MTARTAAIPLVLILAAGASGCVGVAASVAGGALLGCGIYSLHDTREETVALPLDETERLTREVLCDLDVVVSDVRKTRAEDGVTGCHFEGCLIGDSMLPVDVVLERLSDRMTKVQVTARKDWFHPEPEAAEEILSRIVALARRAAVAPSATTGKVSADADPKHAASSTTKQPGTSVVSPSTWAAVAR